MQPSDPHQLASLEVPVAPVIASDPGRRSPILLVSIIVVALLAGGALFMSGYSIGRQ